jgi:excisionase family DNA binding protein
VAEGGERADDELLTLQEAAGRLKVHYMTAYRWVRKGELPALKAGGRLRVRSEDLDRFLTEREIDVARPSTMARRTNWAVHVERLTELLLDGRGIDVGSLIRKVVSDGAPAGDVYLHLIAPALHRVGEEWANGRIGVAVEHRATEIIASIMIKLGDFFRRRGPSRGTAVTLTPPGELHCLPSQMVADFLRAAGYDVHHLGKDVPAQELRRFVQLVDTNVVAISLTIVPEDPALLRSLVSAAREDGDPLVVVGGQGSSPDIADMAGAVHIADLSDLSERLDALARA